MFRNYFKIAFRNIWRHKFLSVTNIMGLAVGIACCILITLYIFHETSYDRFHTKADRIVRTTMEFAFDGNVNKIAVTGNKVFPQFKRVFPEVESGVRMYPDGATVKCNNELFDEKGFVYADSTFFDVFSFKLLKGDPHTALQLPNQVVLSSSIARKYFGNENPIGKTILVDGKKDFVITGVVEDCPTNSQIKYDLLGSFSSLLNERFTSEQWWDASYYTYLLLKRPQDINSLQAKIPAYMKTRNEENRLTGSNYMTFSLQPMKDVHLYAEIEGGFEPGSDYRYIYIFGAIALLILVIAFANYINLTTARAAERAREVGVRKVMGALRNQLFGQFMGESIITVFMALVVSLLLVNFMLPVFNNLADRQLHFSSLLQPGPVMTMLVILVVPGLLGGIYPALVLSGFHPIKVLKGNFKTSSSGIWLRKSLIVGQFVICVGLIVCTLIIQSQLNYIQNKKLGYTKDHILVIPADKPVFQKAQTVKSQLLSNPAITGVTAASQSPTFIPSKYTVNLNGRIVIVNALRADKDYLKTVGIPLRSGSGFTQTDEQFADSPNIQRPLIINESASANFGFTAENAIGKVVNIYGTDHIIRGVIQDFHFSSMHNAISPLIIFAGGSKNRLLVKVSGKQLPQTLDFIKSKWAGLAPHLPFVYEFLDEEFNRLYSSETRTGNLFYSFALLAIGLACLGLLGLSTYTAQQRAKEIGIRKVLGASVSSVVVLLSKEFLKLVGIAALIASPLAWWATHEWLQSFAYRVNVQAWVFVLAIAVSLFIVLATISIQVIKTALANPVKSLKSE